MTDRRSRRTKREIPQLHQVARAAEDPRAREAVAGFGPGTIIATETGDTPVEWLEPGDRVLTRDHGFQSLLWVGRQRVTRRHFGSLPADAFVRIPAGALGSGTPARDLHVTSNQMLIILVSGTQWLHGITEVLAPAQAWADLGLAEAYSPGDGVTLTHLFCAPHQVIHAQGTWSGTLLTDPDCCRRQNSRNFQKLRRLLGPEEGTMAPARVCLSREEARILISRLRDRQSLTLPDSVLRRA